MPANLERFREAMDRTKAAATELKEGDEHTEGLGEEVQTAPLRVGIIATLQQELGHGYIVSLLTQTGKETSIKIKKAS